MMNLLEPLLLLVLMAGGGAIERELPWRWRLEAVGVVVSALGDAGGRKEDIKKQYS